MPKQRFTFNFVPFSLRGVLLLLALCLSACWFNPPLQGKGVAALQGAWQQDAVAGSRQLVSYTLYGFRISCDSVYIRMDNYSKVNTGADSCMNNGRWVEYVRGTYQQSHDTLMVKGFYCNPDYSLKNERGCFNYGPYTERFMVRPKGEWALQLVPLSSTIPIELRLVKEWGCTPKAL